MSHTPGPWVCGTKGFSFPDLRSWQVIPVGTRTDGISQADLNLIAAAPELLEACKTVWMWLNRVNVPFGLEARECLGKAIAKAEGNGDPYAG